MRIRRAVSVHTHTHTQGTSYAYHGGWLCSSDFRSPGDILCLSVQFSSAQWLPRSLLPLCTIRKDFFFRPRVFFRTYVDVGVFAVVPRGCVRKLGSLQRSKFLLRRISYYSNASCAFNPAVYKILCSGDVETNPGYVPECTMRPQRQGHTSKLKVFYTNARSIVNKVAKLQLELANSQADIVVLTVRFQVRRSSAAITQFIGKTALAMELDMAVVF